MPSYSDFGHGSLHLKTYARRGKRFTANSRVVVSDVGSLKADALHANDQAVIDTLRGSLAS